MLHQIGVGALGPVFRTYEPTRDRLVAVKVFRFDITPEQAQALAGELSKAAEAGLFHPSIVEPIAAGVEGSLPYRAEEYVAAESLDVAMRHYAPAALDKALPFIAQLAGAIDFARAAGIGHGALHPRDVFVTPDEARATGFGVVEALERVGLRAPVRRPYSAPERIAEGPWGAEADVFSLAAIAYELLTGRRPAGTGSQIGGTNGSPGGDLDGRIEAVLVRAMDDHPASRFPSALAFASALEAAARGDAVPAAPSAPRAVAPAAAVAPVPEIPAAPAVQEPGDDVDAERDEDEAHHAWLAAERGRAADVEAPSLFDEEAEADRFMLEAAALDTTPPLEAEPFADEVELSHDRGAELRSAVVLPYQGDRKTPEPPRLLGAAPGTDGTHAGEGPRMLPLAVTLVIGLLLGFAAGYAVASRSRTTVVAGTAAAPPPASPQQQPPAAGREFSEQVVRPTPPQTATAAPSGTPPAVAPDAQPDTAPVGAPPPAPTTGQIVVRSTPARAGVTINGRWRGRTPLTLDGLPFATYTVRVVQPGFAVASEDVALSSSAPSRTVQVRLRPEEAAARARPRPQPPARPTAAPARFTGSLYVDSRPRGARVLIDGRAVGTTPLLLPEVDAGSHVVRLELENHRPVALSKRVAAGEEARVTLSLEPER